MGADMTSRIIGTGSCLPETIITNDWLSERMDTSDEWITSRTGIRERRLVREETTADMAEQASRLALEQAGIAPEDLDLIVVGTITADHVTPSAACELQARLGAKKAMAFDINAACSGFVFSLETADAGGGNTVKNYGLDGQEHLRPVRRRRGRCGACPGGNRDFKLRSGLRRRQGKRIGLPRQRE